jgi:hypothetical protein
MKQDRYLNGVYDDYGELLDELRMVMADLDARLAALEGKAPESPEPTSELFTLAVAVSGYNYYESATLPQVRAVAVRLGLLDTPRQELEHKLWRAVTVDDDGNSVSYDNVISVLRRLDIRARANMTCPDLGGICHRLWEVLVKAAVLEAAQAEGEGEG